MANDAKIPTKADLLKTALGVFEMDSTKYIVESANFETSRNSTLAGHGISHPVQIRCNLNLKVDEDFNKIYKAYCNKRSRLSGTLTLKASSSDKAMETYKFAGLVVSRYAYEFLDPRQQAGNGNSALRNHTVSITIDALKSEDMKGNYVNLEN